jgi:hypothetical protein
MDLRIQIKTTEPVNLPSFHQDDWMSEMFLLISGGNQFFGNIYHKDLDALNDIRKCFEALPKLLAFSDYYDKLKRNEVMSIKEIEATQTKLLTLLSEIKQITT